jgi:drug/metabolite transporter (DMT)-like permease
MTSTNKNIFYILMILAMAGWGASWVNAKVLSSYVNEYEMIFFRNIFTLITLAPVLVISRKYFYINKRSFLLAILAAIIMIIYLKCYFLGTKFGTASLGGALVTTLIPINTFLFMALFFGKKILKKDIFALCIGAIGVLTMLNIWSFSYEEIFSTQNMYFLGASVLWPALTITSSKITKTSPMVFTFYMYIISTILVSIFFVDFKNIPYESFDFIFWTNILILAIISTTFATTVYFVGIEKLGTNEVSSFIFLVPFFAIIFSIIFLGETVYLSTIIGVVLTIFAVKILNNITLKKTKKKSTIETRK